MKVGQAILSVEDGPRQAQGEAPGAAAPGPKPAPVQAAPPPHLRTRAGARREARPAPTKVVDFARGVRPAAEQPSSDGPSAPAAPSVRRMARSWASTSTTSPGTGDDGRISIEDVKAHAKRLIASGGAAAGAGAAGPRVAAEPLPDFSKWGAVERQPMRGVRRKTAEHLGASWAQVPLVTQYDSADITGFEEVRKRHAKQAGEGAPALTVTALAIKIVAAALKTYPQFNVSIDMAAEEIIVKKYIHIGVAVDTDRGLLVPVVRDADTKSLPQISAESRSSRRKRAAAS